jgi:hypothetical protein
MSLANCSNHRVMDYLYIAGGNIFAFEYLLLFPSATTKILSFVVGELAIWRSSAVYVSAAPL